MPTLRRVLDLSPEEIRKISEKAVETVAARKIVTNSGSPRSSSPTANARGMKTGDKDCRGHNTIQHAKGSNIRNTGSRGRQSESGVIKQARAVVETVISQGNSQKFLQDSFDKIVKSSKK